MRCFTPHNCIYMRKSLLKCFCVRIGLLGLLYDWSPDQLWGNYIIAHGSQICCLGLWICVWVEEPRRGCRVWVTGTWAPPKTRWGFGGWRSREKRSVGKSKNSKPSLPPPRANPVSSNSVPALPRYHVLPISVFYSLRVALFYLSIILTFLEFQILETAFKKETVGLVTREQYVEKVCDCFLYFYMPYCGVSVTDIMFFLIC